jgi:hypothetical protein
MTAKLMRHDMMKAVAAAGGLLVLGLLACAAPLDEKNSKLSGEWLYEGKKDEPCAIFQQGRVLLVVNENGDLATGRITAARRFIVLRGDGWEEGLVGELVGQGKAISWTNGTTWKRP